MISEEQFYQDVRTEIENIKKYATADEISRLDIMHLDARTYKSCVYGQMTGHCNSDRALELISKCCVRFVNNLEISGWINRFDILQTAFLENTARASELIKTRKKPWIRILSALEVYAMLYAARTDSIISFLRSETDKLTLTYE